MADPRTEIARALSADEWVQRHLGIVAHARDVADTAVAALEAAGFVLLSSGGEEQYRIVWSGQEGTYVDGEIDDLQDGLDHLAIIRGLSFVKEAHLERRILTDWSPVVSDNSEGESGG